MVRMPGRHSAVDTLTRGRDRVILADGKALRMERCADAAVYDVTGEHVIGMVAAGVYLSEIRSQVFITLGRTSLLPCVCGRYLPLAALHQHLKGELLGFEPREQTDLFLSAYGYSGSA